MTDWALITARAIELASEPGPEFAPARLIEACAKEANPVAALFDNDKANEFFDDFDTELGFIVFARRNGKSISKVEFDRLTEVVRWFIREFTGWRKELDPSLAKLASFFVVVTRLDEDGAVWADMPQVIGANADLIHALADQLGRIRFSLSLEDYSLSPISGQETIDQYKKADRNQDWASLRHMSEHYPFAMFPSVVLTQTIRFLSRFSPNLLTNAVSSVNQTLVAMQIVSAMTVDAALAIARETSNPYIQFASVARLFSSHQPVREMTKSAEDALVDLLHVVSTDAKQWRSWMKAFNAHPIQTKVIQPALGRCLANVDEVAQDEYFRNIILNTNDASRDAVTTCLSVFAEVASESKRQRVWYIAYAIWSEWNFGEHDGYTRPIAIVTSPIDYAIVRYAIECLGEGQRDKLIAECLTQIEEAENLWHSSVIHCTAFVYRALSRSQPFFHAKNCLNGKQDRLMKRRVYIPKQLQEGFYWRLRYHIDQPRGEL